LLYRSGSGGTEVLLVHPGGPFWRTRQWGSWSVPKGEIEEGEEPESVAAREFEEELGSAAPPGDRVDLGEVRQKNGKRVRAWAVGADFDVSSAVSNTFLLEWPPRSGQQAEFPEVDEARWFSLEEARRRIIPAQAAFLDRLPPPC
jgi:predicted NUDIX family NTP pyrophosphohydrolase